MNHANHDRSGQNAHRPVDDHHTPKNGNRDRNGQNARHPVDDHHTRKNGNRDRNAQNDVLRAGHHARCGQNDDPNADHHDDHNDHRDSRQKNRRVRYGGLKNQNDAVHAKTPHESTNRCLHGNHVHDAARSQTYLPQFLLSWGPMTAPILN